MKGVLFIFVCCFVLNVLGDDVINGRVENRNEGYVCAGNGYYYCGTQKGTVIPHGWHISGEMSGLWMQPIKLLKDISFQVDFSTKEGLFSFLNGDAKVFKQFPWGNEFEYMNNGCILYRREYVIDEIGFVMELHGKGHDLEYFDVLWNIPIHLRGTWLSELVDDIDECYWNDVNSLFSCRDKSNDRFVSIKTMNDDFIEKSIYNNRISFKERYLSSSFIFISGSIISEQDAIEKALFLFENSNELLEQKKRIFNDIKYQSNIDIPDENIQTMYTWSKYNVKWLMNSIDNIGNGVFGGLPEYPMFYGCDTTYTVEGLLNIGFYREARSSLDLLATASLKSNHNGRIIHEMTAQGNVFHPGNIQETAHFLIQVKNVYEHTGDIAWIIKNYESLKRGVEFLQSQDSDGNSIPEGTGIMEIGSFYLPTIEMIDVVVYSLEAYKSVVFLYQEIEIAIIQNNINHFDWKYYSDRIDCDQHSEDECINYGCTWSPISSEEYRNHNLPSDTPWCHFPFWQPDTIPIDDLKKQTKILQKLIKEINIFIEFNSWIQEQNCFAEFFANSKEVVPIIEAAIGRVSSLPNRNRIRKALQNQLKQVQQENTKLVTNDVLEKRGWNIYQSWITSIPLEMGLSPMSIASKALDEAINRSSPYGMYVTAIDKPDGDWEIEKNMNNGLYTNAVMTLPTGVQAVSEAKYKNSTQVLHYLNQLANSFSYKTPGTLHEMSPSGGCFVQAWSIYSISVPIINGIFGISSKYNIESGYTITISPLFPSTWNYMNIDNYIIGENGSSLSMHCKGNWNVKFECEIDLVNHPNNNIDVFFELNFLQESLIKAKEYKIYLGNDLVKEKVKNDSITFQLKSKTKVDTWVVKLISSQNIHDEL